VLDVADDYGMHTCPPVQVGGGGMLTDDSELVLPRPLRRCRLCVAVDVPWQAVGREEVQDFLGWLQVTDHPQRAPTRGSYYLTGSGCP